MFRILSLLGITYDTNYVFWHLLMLTMIIVDMIKTQPISNVITNCQYVFEHTKQQISTSKSSISVTEHNKTHTASLTQKWPSVFNHTTVVRPRSWYQSRIGAIEYPKVKYGRESDPPRLPRARALRRLDDGRGECLPRPARLVVHEARVQDNVRH